MSCAPLPPPTWRSYRRRFSVAPFAAVALDQHVRLWRSRRSRRIGREARTGVALPLVEDGLDGMPSGFHHVHPVEERLVACHRIEQQRLVSGRWLRFEILRVAE